MTNELKELYAQYGELLVQAEIIQNRINSIKPKIQEALNRIQMPQEPIKEDSNEKEI